MTDTKDAEVYDWADAAEAAMETKPLGTGWTPSTVGRKAKITTDQARAALRWLVENRYIDADDRGAWTRYYLQTGRYVWTDDNGLPTNKPPGQRARQRLT